MVVNIIPVTRDLTMAGTVASPSGQGDGGPGGIIMNADLTENGDYRIEVSQHTMGSNYASGAFILEVVITPAWLRARATSHKTDAMSEPPTVVGGPQSRQDRRSRAKRPIRYRTGMAALG